MCNARQQNIGQEERREAFRQETLQAWEAYQESGLHVTGDEVIAWLQTWGADEETAPPSCHR